MTTAVSSTANRSLTSSLIAGAIGGDQWMSLLGHLIFGVVTGLLFIPLSKRF